MNTEGKNDLTWLSDLSGGLVRELEDEERRAAMGRELHTRMRAAARQIETEATQSRTLGVITEGVRKAHEWLVCSLKSMNKSRQVIAYAKSKPRQTANDIRTLEFEASLPDKSMAKIFWSMEHSWYEIDFDRGSATAVRVGDQEFMLVVVKDSSLRRIDAPSMAVAHALNGVQAIEFGDYTAKLP